jgi:hypothetical protein
MAKKTDELSMEIIDEYGYLNKKESKFVSIIKWGDNDNTLDIRRCGKNKDGKQYVSKGISLSYDEAEELYNILKDNLKKIKKKMDP